MPFPFSRSRGKVKKQAYVQVRLLDGSTDEFKVDRKICGDQLWDTFINRSALQEKDFFGLQFDFVEGEFSFSTVPFYHFEWQYQCVMGGGGWWREKER